MKIYLEIFILIPLAGFLLSWFVPAKNEKWVSRTAFYTVGLHFFSFLFFLAFWLANGAPELDLKDVVLFQTDHYEFFIDLYFDHISAVYMGVGALLTFMVTIYSRVYLHRESGFKRFFTTILFFYSGYCIIIFSGNLETLFIGWEVLVASSFLLIAFYRSRYLPVRNAVKVYSIYRLGDIGLILAMWLSHHLWHESITFLKLNNQDLVHSHLQEHSWVGIAISLLILLAATAKSAQLPFSSWLPRAMEGPTPSSAIFYGSLSVHLGVFLLMRTYPFWENQIVVRFVIGALGVCTSVVASGIARVQSNVKSQIAYASIAQIGLIFLEVALGLEWLALLHFAGNAFLRTYQLLVSPSVVTYLIREQFYTFTPPPTTVEDSFPRRLQYSLYVLCLKEFNLDTLIYRFYWNPLKKLGGLLRFLNLRSLVFLFIPLYSMGVFYLLHGNYIPESLQGWIPPLFSFIGMLMVLRSFTERKSLPLAWSLIVMNHFWIALAVSFNEKFGIEEDALYLSGILASGVLGYLCIAAIMRREKGVSLDRFQGHAYEHPRLALVFFIACLGLTGFPITTAFIGEDVIFGHIHENQVGLAGFTALSLIVDGLAVMRIFTRVFMGPHVKNWHESAYRSS